MTIIVTKPRIIIDVVGSYFYEKNMTENGLFFLGGPRTHLHDILWAVHDGKNRGRSEGKENFRELPVTVGGRGPRYYRSHRAVLPQGPAVLPLRRAVLPHAPDQQTRHFCIDKKRRRMLQSAKGKAVQKE